MGLHLTEAHVDDTVVLNPGDSIQFQFQIPPFKKPMSPPRCPIHSTSTSTPSSTACSSPNLHPESPQITNNSVEIASIQTTPRFQMHNRSLPSTSDRNASPEYHILDSLNSEESLEELRGDLGITDESHLANVPRMLGLEPREILENPGQRQSFTAVEDTRETVFSNSSQMPFMNRSIDLYESYIDSLRLLRRDFSSSCPGRFRTHAYQHDCISPAVSRDNVFKACQAISTLGEVFYAMFRIEEDRLFCIVMCVGGIDDAKEYMYRLSLTSKYENVTLQLATPSILTENGQIYDQDICIAVPEYSTFVGKDKLKCRIDIFKNDDEAIEKVIEDKSRTCEKTKLLILKPNFMI